MDEDFLVLIENLSLSVPTDSKSPGKDERSRKQK